MRSAEKSRVSSCLFSDKIANITIKEYFKQCPNNLRNSYQQTVLSSIILEEKDINKFELISFGIGTKYLKYHYRNKLNNKISKKYFLNLRDCHAEILTRRGFILFLYREIKLFLKQTIQLLKENSNINILSIQNRLFEYVFIESLLPIKRSIDGNETINQFENLRLKLKDNIQFHMYTSSSPCGNSCIKRWAKGQTIQTFNNLNENEYPNQVHPRLYVTAPQEGQVSVLMKKGSSLEVRFTSDLEINSHENENENENKNLILSQLLNEIQPSIEDYNFSVPSYPNQFLLPGTSFPPSYPIVSQESITGLSLTCSDKITLWNGIGIQGSFLSHLLSNPIYLKTITIGRKYSIPHVYRGLCCRIQDFQNNIYSCNHPIILCTSVKLDEGIIITSSLSSSLSSSSSSTASCSSTIKNDDVNISENDINNDNNDNNDNNKIGANFQESRCVCYVTGVSYSQIQNDSNEDLSIFDVIDGESGMLYQETNIEQVTKEENIEDIDIKRLSSICSYNLYQKYKECEKLREDLINLLLGKQIDLIDQKENEEIEKKFNEINEFSVEEYLSMKKIGYQQVQHHLKVQQNQYNNDQNNDDNNRNRSRLSQSSYCESKHKLITSRKSYIKGWVRTTTMLNSMSININSDNDNNSENNNNSDEFNLKLDV